MFEKAKGKFQQLRRYGGWFLLLLFCAYPMDPFGEGDKRSCSRYQRNSSTSLVQLYPQDQRYSPAPTMIAAFGLFFITTSPGLDPGCGYLCPQTVWTFMYIWFEEKLREGAANKRKKQDSKQTHRQLGDQENPLKHIAGGLLSQPVSLLLATSFQSKS